MSRAVRARILACMHTTTTDTLSIRLPSSSPLPSSTPLPSSKKGSSPWLVPLGLLALSVVPTLAGVVRFAEIVQGDVTAENARFLHAPISAVLHIVGANLFAIAGAFQVTSVLRTLHRRAHTWLGRVTLPLGYVTALSGLYMTATYPPAPESGMGITIVRLVVVAAMLVFAVVGTRALVRRDYRAHGAWMLRLYALGIGGGTQFFTHLPWFVVVGGIPPADVSVALMAGGWIINVLVAESVIAKGRRAT